MTQFCVGPPNLIEGVRVDNGQFATNADEAWLLADASEHGCCHRGGGVYLVESQTQPVITRVLKASVPRGRTTKTFLI